MTIKREFYFKRLFLAFLIATILFILIQLFSISVSYINSQRIDVQTNIITNHIETMRYFLSTTEEKCNNELLFQSGSLLDSIGSKISTLEERFGKEDSRVLEQKKIYQKLELEHLRVIKEIEKSCNKNFDIIIYFYSNIPPKDKESDRVGFILSTLKKSSPETIMIYSFDFNIKENEINELKEKFQIENAPLIIINEKTVLNPKNINDVRTHLEE